MSILRNQYEKIEKRMGMKIELKFLIDTAILLEKKETSGAYWNDNKDFQHLKNLFIDQAMYGDDHVINFDPVSTFRNLPFSLLQLAKKDFQNFRAVFFLSSHSQYRVVNLDAVSCIHLDADPDFLTFKRFKILNFIHLIDFLNRHLISGSQNKRSER